MNKEEAIRVHIKRFRTERNGLPKKINLKDGDSALEGRK